MPQNKLLEIPGKQNNSLKEKNEIFVKGTQFLFGERFDSDIVRTVKRKQKSEKVFSPVTTVLLKGSPTGTPTKEGWGADCQVGALQNSFTTHMETRPTTTPK